MIKIGIQDLENIFKNVRIRFSKERKKSDELYIEILLDEIQIYFSNLNSFSFDDDKIFISQDKILTLKKYLYTLTTISDNITTIYNKSDEIINELNKLINVNIFERETIVNKLDKIHNYILSHSISSEQNIDNSIYFRENFNNNNYEDKNAGSFGVKIDSYAGVLKLNSIQTKRKINKNSLKINLSNFKNNSLFPENNLSISDFYDLDDGIYFNDTVKNEESILRNYLTDEEEENDITSTPIEVIYTNPLDFRDIEKQIKQNTNMDFGRIELREESFLQKYISSSKIDDFNPILLLTFIMDNPISCNHLDIKFDKIMPKFITHGKYLKGNVFDEKKGYPIINMDINNNNSNFPYFRIYWGKHINLKRLSLHLKSSWIDKPIKLIKWNSNLQGVDNVQFRKILFTEKFDTRVYNRINSENLEIDTLSKNVLELSNLGHGK